MDDVLEAFLASPDDKRSEERLGDLLADHAAPLVRRIVSRRLGLSSSDIDDVCSRVMLQLMLRLRRERIDQSLAAIDAFASYVATAAHHGCDHFIRARYPLRWRLRGRLRYVLERDARFSLWRDAEGSLTCGRTAWRGRPGATAAPDAAELSGIRSGDVRALLERLFDRSAAPLALAAVVNLAAEAWAIPLHQQDDRLRLETVADPEPRVDLVLEQRARMAGVWRQICDLPLRQRQALLLNLKDNAVTVFLTTGAASLRDIAAALELPVEQLAALWNDLPLPDNTIAARLGCTRQQVINLRMSARQRLANHLVPRANIDARRDL